MTTRVLFPISYVDSRQGYSVTTISTMVLPDRNYHRAVIIRNGRATPQDRITDGIIRKDDNQRVKVN